MATNINTTDRAYGLCSTAAATAAKVVNCPGFILTDGQDILVKFTVTNTAANPTLNVDNTGAYPIYYRGSAIGKDYLAANRTYMFVWNGTQYDFIGDINVDTNTDTKVRQTLVTTENTSRPLLLSYLNSDNTTANVDNVAYRNNSLFYNSSTASLSVPKIVDTSSITMKYTANGGTVYTAQIVKNNTGIHISQDHAVNPASAFMPSLDISNNGGIETGYNTVGMSYNKIGFLTGLKSNFSQSTDSLEFNYTPDGESTESTFMFANLDKQRLNINGQLYAHYTGTIQMSRKQNNTTMVPIETTFKVRDTEIYLGIKKNNSDENNNYLRMSHSHTYLNGGSMLTLNAGKSARLFARNIEIESSGATIKLHENSLYLRGDTSTEIKSDSARLRLNTGANITGETIELNSNRSTLKLQSDIRIETNKFRLYNTTKGHNITNKQKMKFYIDTNLASMAFGEKVLNRMYNGTTFTTTIASGQSSVAFGDNVIVSGTHAMGVGKGTSTITTYTPSAKSYNSSTRKWTLTLTAAQVTAITNLYGTTSTFMVLIYVNGETIERHIKPCKAKYASSTTIELLGINDNVDAYSTYNIINSTAVANLRVSVVNPTFLVRGNYSFATGENLLAYGDHQTVIGMWNASDTTSLFMIGAGTSSSARKNIVTVNSTDTIMKTTLVIEGPNSSYAEGLRINKGNGNYSTILLGGNAGSTRGTQDGAWWIGVNNTNSPRKLMFANNGSTATNAYFYAEDSGTSNISLHIKGITATGTVELMGSDLHLKTSGSSSNDSGDIAFFYGNGQEKSKIWTANTYDTKAGPNYRVYKSDGTSLYNGTLPLADGTGASGTWGISISGNASTATSATSATSASRLTVDEVTVQTGSSAQSHITLDTLMTWLITTKKYIPSNVKCNILISCSWSYAGNDILQFNANGTNYELQLAGCKIEFIGHASNYNTGQFRLIIHSSPAISFIPNSGYTQFPASHVCEYFCNGSGYSPTWKVYVDRSDLGSAAYTASTAYATSDHTQSIAKGGTGATTAEDALTNLGLKLTEITKSVTFTTANTWYDTGISGTNIPDNGTYIVQISNISSTGTSLYGMIYSGVMSWRKDGTSDSSQSTEEVLLHAAGHNPNGRRLYLRTLIDKSTSDGGTGLMKLQICSNFSSSTTAVSIKFRFRKILPE